MEYSGPFARSHSSGTCRLDRKCVSTYCAGDGLHGRTMTALRATRRNVWLTVCHIIAVFWKTTICSVLCPRVRKWRHTRAWPGPLQMQLRFHGGGLPWSRSLSLWSTQANALWYATGEQLSCHVDCWLIHHDGRCPGGRGFRYHCRVAGAEAST